MRAALRVLFRLTDPYDTPPGQGASADLMLAYLSDLSPFIKNAIPYPSRESDHCALLSSRMGPAGHAHARHRHRVKCRHSQNRILSPGEQRVCDILEEPLSVAQWPSHVDSQRQTISIRNHLP